MNRRQGFDPAERVATLASMKKSTTRFRILRDDCFAVCDCGQPLGRHLHDELEGEWLELPAGSQPDHAGVFRPSFSSRKRGSNPRRPAMGSLGLKRLAGGKDGPVVVPENPTEIAIRSPQAEIETLLARARWFSGGQRGVGAPAELPVQLKCPGCFAIVTISCVEPIDAEPANR